MSRIRLNTERIRETGRRFRDRSDHLAEISRELARAAGSLDAGAWDGASRARAEPLLGRAHPEGTHLAHRLEELGHKLARVAEAFEQEDGNAAHILAGMPWVDWDAGAGVQAQLPKAPPLKVEPPPAFNIPIDPAIVSGCTHRDPISYNNGMINDEWRGRHIGIDYAPPGGENRVVASAAGVIVTADIQTGYGHYVIVEYPAGSLPAWVIEMPEYAKGDSAYAIYAHLATPVEKLPSPGRAVRRGAFLGVVGATGNALGTHLHTEVRFGAPGMNVRASGDHRWYDADILTPVDPMAVFREPRDPKRREGK